MSDLFQARPASHQPSESGQSKGWLCKFHQNERGTTLTEFLITLPIFILIFFTMVRMGQFQLQSGQIWATAYQDTWNQALPITEKTNEGINPSDKHANPANAGASARSQLAQHTVYNKTDAIESSITGFENTTYSGLQNGGHWGESAQRVRPAEEFIKLRGVDGLVSADPGTIIGSSGYARSVVSDSGSISAANAAGIRYGTVAGVGESDTKIMGYDIPMYVHFNTLVAPMPYNESSKTTEAARTLMLGQKHYSNILGISMSQPLSSGGGSVSAPKIEWPPQH